jgi:hypothetical protein
MILDNYTPTTSKIS